MKGMNCNIVSSFNLNYFPYHSHSVLPYVLIEQFIFKVPIRGLHIKFVTQLHLPYQRGPLRNTFQWRKKSHVDFPCHSIQSTLITSFLYFKDTITVYTSTIHNLTTSFKVSLKYPINIIQGHI